jgi:Ca2+-binding EF-hand superfamily protein
MKKLLPLALLLSACAYENPHSEAAQGRKMMALLEKFDRWDYNADGKLTRAEILQGIKESDVEGVDEAEVDRAIKFYDVNHDGAVSRWEAEHALDKPVPGFGKH